MELVKKQRTTSTQQRNPLISVSKMIILYGRSIQGGTIALCWLSTYSLACHSNHHRSLKSRARTCRLLTDAIFNPLSSSGATVCLPPRQQCAFFWNAGQGTFCRALFRAGERVRAAEISLCAAHISSRWLPAGRPACHLPATSKNSTQRHCTTRVKSRQRRGA